MKAILSPLVILIIMLLSSCDIRFSSPQPDWITKNEKEIPKKFRGTYLVKGKFLGDQKNDTLRIGEKRIFDNHDTDFSLSDTVLLKVDHPNYFLNLYDKKEKTWLVILAKEEKKNNLCLYYLSSEDSVMNKVKEITKADQKSNNEYVLHSSPEEFRKILEANLFRVGDTLIRIK